MKEWNEYINSVLYTPSPLDEITVGYDNCKSLFPPIIKASIYMLEQMIKERGRHNIFVFPEFNQLSRDFLLAKVLYNLLSGKIQMDYDPEKFRLGQKLKYKKYIMEFVRLEQGTNGKKIVVKFSDLLEYSVPLEFAPYLQITTAAHLSSYKKFKSEYSVKSAKEKKDNADTLPSRETIPKILADHKTHLDGSVFLVSTISHAKKYLSEVKINGQRLKECMLLAQTDSEGNLINITAGQLDGNPAIVIVPDLYSLMNAINAGATIQSVIFDASPDNSIEKQLDAFDDLEQYDFPVVCITDTSHSFGLSALTERGYNIWRWNESNLTDTLAKHSFPYTSCRIRNCSAHNIHYQYCDDPNIKELADILFKNKKMIPDLSPGINSVFDTLLSQLFSLLRRIVPFSSDEVSRIQTSLNSCSFTLSEEKPFLASDLFNELSRAVELESTIMAESYKNQKEIQIKDILLKHNKSRICVVIPEQHDKEQVKAHLQHYILQNRISAFLTVMYPQEYQQNETASFHAVIITGWIKEKIMKQCLYNHASPLVEVLLYHCENRWKKAHTRQWARDLDNSGTESIANQVFGQKQLKPVNDIDVSSELPDIEIETENDYDSLDDYIRFNRVRKYSVSGSSKAEQIEAFPVSLVGGFLAFYKSTHKLITVTDIITQNKERIVMKTLLAENSSDHTLSVGDFIVVRESDKDLIRSIADKLIAKSDMPDARKIANRWREALIIEKLFSFTSEIVEKIRAAGCPNDPLTIRQWLTNDEMIIPRDKENLRYIAIATEDDVLSDTMDAVFAAGSFVDKIHKQAGRILSLRLKMKIAEFLQNNESIDPYNFWEPLVFSIEDVGIVKILKVIDVGEAVTVDAANTNRLLTD